LSEILPSGGLGLDRWIDLFGGTELIMLDVLPKTEKKRWGTKENTGYLVRSPIIYVRLINVFMVKVVSTTRRAVAV